MTSSTHERAQAPYWSWRGLIEGARLSLPMLPGVVVFSAAFGTIAVQKGLTLGETVAMNAIVFAGAAQLVVMEIWDRALAPATIASIAVVTAIVNARFFLMTASLRPWLGPLPAWQVYPALLLNTDANWLVGIRYRAGGGGDAAVYLGSGIALWVVWVTTVIPGYMLGAIISNPARFGFDLLLPLFFTAMLVQLWRGARRAIGWAIAGVVALVASWLLPGWWFIVIGALAGSIAGGFIDEHE